MAHKGPICSAARLIWVLPLCIAAKGDGCSSNSKAPAPDVSGNWAITYDDTIEVTIRIGQGTYNEQIAVAGGVIEITHEGRPLRFQLDCDRPEVVCPTEAWPLTVLVEQRNEKFPHRMIVTLPQQQCSEALKKPQPDECGEGTLNPECEEVCPGEITVANRERFGVIGEDGSTFRLFLGAGLATNGINCALLAASVADGDLVNSGGAEDGDWRSEEMTSGLVTVGFAGGCLWAGDPDMDQELEALVLGASIEFRTGFTGTRTD